MCLAVPLNVSFKGVPIYSVDQQFASIWPRKNLSVGDWVRAILSREDSRLNEIELSPPLRTDDRQFDFPELLAVPLRDRAQFAFADRVVALAVSRGGNTPALLDAAVVDESFAPGSILVHNESCDDRLSAELLSRGAVGLHMIRHRVDRLVGSGSDNIGSETESAPDHSD